MMGLGNKKQPMRSLDVSDIDGAKPRRIFKAGLDIMGVNNYPHLMDPAGVQKGKKSVEK
jgi:hypothetical protein